MIHAAILLFYATASIFLGGSQPSPKPKTEIVIIKSFPSKGTILRHENFRGYQVTIKADGQGGCYRWIADVPWDEFTIEEKFDMVRVGGGHLNKKDMKEMWRKFGDLRQGDI